MLDRRTFLTAFGVLPTAAMAGSLRHAADVARGSQQPSWQVLSAEQAADLDALSSQIIPSDDAPGAREARVVHFIDHSLATWNSGAREPTLAALGEFNALVAQRHPGKRFAQLSPDEQLAFLRANEQHGFFQQMVATTRIGTFANPLWGSNHDGAGYRLLGFEPRFFWEPPFGFYDAEARGTP